jgi:hypothetical protein
MELVPTSKTPQPQAQAQPAFGKSDTASEAETIFAKGELNFLVFMQILNFKL